MRAINHAITGAIIGLSISEPLIAIPVAVLSHFLLDVIPHFGWGTSDEQVRSNFFRYLLYADALACFLLVVVLYFSSPVNWLLASACALAGAAPDFLSINRYIAVVRKKPWKPGLYTKFAGGIQWFERPIGAVVEVAWFIGAVIILTPLLS